MAEPLLFTGEPPEGLPQRLARLEAIIEERRQGLLVAEQEREKAARALRIELERAIQEGDRNLRDHIENQVQQINAALISAEKLEVQRLGTVAQEAKLISEASERAIAKADAANEKRFEGLNEWRGQSADRERSMHEQMGQLASTFLPREVAEAQFSELRRKVAELTEAVTKIGV